MLPLANSEQQEISAAFDEAEVKIREAVAAIEKLVSLLNSKCAFVSNARINQIRNSWMPIGAASFQLSVQRCRMLKFGAARALK